MSDTAPMKSDCVDFLSLLTPTKRRQLLVGSRRIHHAAGTLAFTQEVPDFAIIIDGGLIRVYVTKAGGRQATAYFIHRGELLGQGVVNRPAVRFCVQAVTDADFTSIDVNVLRNLANTDRQVSRALLTYYTGLLAHSLRVIAVRSLGDITERLAFDLLDRACSNQLESGRLIVRASHQQLADSIGSVREVVARSLRKLRDSGLVSTAPNLIRVLDVERLEEIVTPASA